MKKMIMNRLKRTMLLVAILFPTSASNGEQFKANQAVIDYEVVGEGKPVFVLHSGLTSREDLRGLIDALAQNFQVIAPDTREHGLSSNSSLEISYKLMAEDIVSLAKHLDISRAAFVGQSDGGITALTTAHQHPQLVSNLVIIGAGFHHKAIPEGAKDYLSTVKWQHPMDTSSFPGFYLEDYLKGGRKLTDYQSWFNELARMWISSPTFSKKDLSEISSPTLLITGDHNDVPADHFAAFGRSLPNAVAHTIKDADHFLHKSHPDVLEALVSEFLLQTEEGTPD